MTRGVALRPLHVAITSGPTREPIDDVRFVSNVSTGRLGVAVARAFCAAGHRVTLLHGLGSATPEPSLPGLTLVPFESAAALLDALQRTFDAASAPMLLIHAAAVADYAPVKTDGKIKSTAPELIVRMQPTPKVADAFRRTHPRVPIVMFKLEAGITRDELRARATATMRRVGAEAVVANLLSEVGPDAHRAELIRADGSSIAFDGRDALARGLVDAAVAIVGDVGTQQGRIA
ncbi:MAG: phosphopantothenoylcysteine decarboxylase [Planctomycetes bacterium]|nr:phosphopantothenoylcysteine decarboxylase [Planctomycetota bacterium]MCC7170968.1 phosphopantothenoylcysteine decarboxylase [Planctomycetota bacterium]